MLFIDLAGRPGDGLEGHCRPLSIAAVSRNDAVGKVYTGRPAVWCGHCHLAAGVMEGYRNDTHVGALAIRPGMTVGILHNGSLYLVADIIHPFDSVAVLGSIETHLANGFLAL